MDDDTTQDALIERLRARARDPHRRVDVIVDAFSASVRTMDLGGLLGATRGMAADLDRLLGEIRSGRPPGSASQGRAQEVERAMTTPARPDLPAPATEAAIAAAEAELDSRLPAILRRAYIEIADGGFGPGAGLLQVDRAVATYGDLRRDSPGPRASTWPAGLLPLVDRDPGWDCVEVSSGRMVAWDPEGLAERSSAAVWLRSFSELAPSVEAWLTTWVGSRTRHEETADLMARARVTEARRARERIAAMTPEQRAGMGLPEVGWERVVWGGIGLDEDDA